MEVRLKIGSGNMVLEGDNKLKIARAGMQGLLLTAHKYPVTLGVSLSLDGVGLLSPEGTIARAGQELQQETSVALDSGKSLLYLALMVKICVICRRWHCTGFVNILSFYQRSWKAWRAQHLQCIPRL